MLLAPTSKMQARNDASYPNGILAGEAAWERCPRSRSDHKAQGAGMARGSDLGVRSEGTGHAAQASRSNIFSPKRSQSQHQASHMKSVFDTKPTSVYDDDISQHYHFPQRYLSIVKQAVGDWIVLRRPRADGGNLAYFAAARVIEIEPDPDQSGMNYARLSDYLPFDIPVPWTIGGRYSEEALRNIPQAQVGVFLRGRSVRALSDQDFLDITQFGFLKTFAIAGEAMLTAEPPDQRVKKVIQALVNRVVRDASFRSNVYEAYNHTCAITGLRILDCSGNSEVHAAHIWSVADGGPDVVQNGIALSGTAHWLFDHYLISVTDDHRLLTAPGKVPAELRALMVPSDAQLLLPTPSNLHPHPKYLKRHRGKFLEVNGLK
jgi:putative restriction endonuclease